MASGTSAGFWDDEKTPALLKHEILGRYLPKFVAKLTSSRGRVVLIDGYAGAGRYVSGAPGSALQMVQIAKDLVVDERREVDVYLIEKDRETIDFLKNELAHFVNIPRLRVFILEADVISKFVEIVVQAAGLPLFIFLDPCGLGLPFSILSDVLSKIRPATRGNHEPTEILLNFSAGAVRRIGGLVRHEEKHVAALAHMDENLGGVWWRDSYRGSFDKESAENDVVQGYVDRLGQTANMFIFPVTVRSDVGKRAVYYLVFGTRHIDGAWYYLDSVARSEAKWETEVALRKSSGQMTFEGIGATVEEQRKSLEDEAEREIANNLLVILKREGDFTVEKHMLEVFGDYLGRVREQVVRKAIKSLHKQGLTASDGQGSPIYKLTVTRPT